MKARTVKSTLKWKFVMRNQFSLCLSYIYSSILLKISIVVQGTWVDVRKGDPTAKINDEHISCLSNLTVKNFIFFTKMFMWPTLAIVIPILIFFEVLKNLVPLSNVLLLLQKKNQDKNLVMFKINPFSSLLKTSDHEIFCIFWM